MLGLTLPAAIPPANAGPVTVRRFGHFVFITPPVQALEERFFTVDHGATNDPEFGFCVLPVASPLVRSIMLRDGRPAQEAFAGLMPFLVKSLRDAGHTVNEAGPRLAKLSPPDLRPFVNGKLVDRGLLDFVHATERGLIRYDRRGKVRPARLIAQMALAWPDARIVAVVTRARDAARLRRALERLLRRRVGLSTSRNPEAKYRRVFVATPSRLGSGVLAIERRHLYVAVNPDELFSDGYFGFAVEGLRHAHRSRLYGLLPTDAQPSPRRRDQMTALFGSGEYLVPRHGYRPRVVSVAFIRVAGGSPLAINADKYTVKRDGVHEHAVRNRRLVRLARALASNDRCRLQHDFPSVALFGNRIGRVGVLAAHFGHALRLARMLDWPLVAGPDVLDDGLDEDDLERLEMGGDATIRTTWPVVVTPAGLKRAGRFDVLIRADGGIGLPALPPAVLTVPEGEERPLLLIDVRDEHHPLLRRWSAARRRAYMTASWMAGTTLSTPLARFLANRPRVRA